jgi:aspartyl-tRNA(Asn)/glutamyl-tRNA(Gln) amidotransferase subunit A
VDYRRGLEAGVAGVRIGVPRDFYFEALDEDIERAARDCLVRLETAGAIVEEVCLPDMEHARTVSLTIQMPEALSYHSRHLGSRRELYSEELRTGLALGQFILAEHYVRARRMIERYRREMSTVFDRVDVIATPTTPTVAPPIGTRQIDVGGGEEALGNALTRFTTFFNMSGHPALSVPSGMHRCGLPMGVQLVGRHYEEALVLRVAHELEGRLDLDVGAHLPGLGSARVRGSDLARR